MYLAKQRLYTFAWEGNDSGPLIFDGRTDMESNEYPIRVYNYDYGGDMDGLSEVIFSSFTKLLECMIHLLKSRETKKIYDVILDFFHIDPKGAGQDGIDYWLSWAAMLRANDEREWLLP